MNLDTGRAGLWSGGLFHFTAQARYGDNPSNTFTAGGATPQYMGLVHPAPQPEYIYQRILPGSGALAQFSVVLGRISDIYIPDVTLIGNSYAADFANFNFLKNPMTLNFYNPTALAALAMWTPKKSIAIARHPRSLQPG